MSSVPSEPIVRIDDLDLPTLVSLVGAAVDRRVLDSLTAAGIHGLRTGHGYVIQRLVAGPSTVSEIGKAVGVSQQAVSKIVHELVALGYVESSTDPSDRRRHPLVLTARGRIAVATAREGRMTLHDEVIEQVTSRDLAAARRVLSQLAAQLGLDEEVARRSVPAPAERT